MYQQHYENDHLSGHYDEEQRILFVRYRGVLTPEVTAQVYRWTADLIVNGPHRLDEVQGSIYDFRAVTRFDNRNLTSAQRQSQNLNQQNDMSLVAVALIVANLYQEELLRVSMKISPGQERKRIVRSDEEALAFLASFHRAHQKPASEQ